MSRNIELDDINEIIHFMGHEVTGKLSNVISYSSHMMKEGSENNIISEINTIINNPYSRVIEVFDSVKKCQKILFEM
ncbi:MAG: hypothetical protein ACTSW1_19505 [Candidatus Hodarchaeales archaeon]